jgi:hypothetical protein
MAAIPSSRSTIRARPVPERVGIFGAMTLGVALAIGVFVMVGVFDGVGVIDGVSVIDGVGEMVGVFDGVGLPGAVTWNGVGANSQPPGQEADAPLVVKLTKLPSWSAVVKK